MAIHGNTFGQTTRPLVSPGLPPDVSDVGEPRAPAGPDASPALPISVAEADQRSRPLRLLVPENLAAPGRRGRVSFGRHVGTDPDLKLNPRSVKVGNL